MVVEEESAGNVERNEDINAVVFVRCKNKEDPKAVAEPCKCMKEKDSSRGVLRDEEVE